MEEQSQVKKIQKIEAAAHFNGQNLIPSLMQLIGYRQRVAQDLLRADGLLFEQLDIEFNYVNEKILEILGM